MEFILILGNTGFLACKEYKYAVLPVSLEGYFTRSPYKLPPNNRSRILSEVAKYPYLVNDRKGVVDVEIPTSFPCFFPDLALYSDGLGCLDCLYYTRNRNSIQSHFSSLHEWENLKGKGRTPKNREIEVPWISGVSVQQFFRVTPGQ